MKVLIISRGVPTAKAPLNGIFEWDQALALKNANVDVAFLALDFRKITEKRFWGIRRYVREGISVFELSLPTGVYRRALGLLQFWCKQMYKRVEKHWGKPDVLHSHFYFMGAIAAQLPALSGVPLVHTEHSSKLNKSLDAISSLDKKLAQKAFAAASCITTVSTAYASVLAQNFAVRAQVLPNVLALSSSGTFSLSVNNTSTSSVTEGEPITPFTWVSVGRLIQPKGFDTLLEAFAQTLKEDANQQLQIVGDGSYRGALQTKIQQLHLTDKVKLLGAMPRNKVQECLANAHAFVLLSQSETFGVSYIEAMALGLPVVATCCGGPSDFVNATNGCLVPVGDAAKAADAMCKIKAQYATYQPQQIANEVLQKYAPASVAKQLITQYQMLLP
ncbi:MAG: glycosyltransferase [Paludibacteraceae bacterium]|nr:glycosyltransferase [Paludibacteraceae bacterium]